MHIRALAGVLGLDPLAVAFFFDEVRAPTPTAGLPGRNLRGLRQQRDVPADLLAMSCGVNVSTIYNWESSRVRVPDRALPGLASAFAVTEAWLSAYLVGPGIRPVEVVSPNHPLRRYRKRVRMSQDAVARQIGVNREQISRWERGQPPSIFAVRRLARFYDVPVSVLARECGSTAPGTLDPADWADAPVGEALRALRAWFGISQRELARLVDRKQVTVRSWEAGRSAPTAQMRRRLEQLFNVPPGSLVVAGTGSEKDADDRAVS